jgi:hypothetical protein
MKMTALCGLVEVDRRLRGVYLLHHQGDEYAPLKRRSTSTWLSKPVRGGYCTLTKLPSSYSPPWEPEMSLLSLCFPTHFFKFFVLFYVIEFIIINILNANRLQYLL